MMMVINLDALLYVAVLFSVQIKAVEGDLYIESWSTFNNESLNLSFVDIQVYTTDPFHHGYWRSWSFYYFNWDVGDVFCTLWMAKRNADTLPCNVVSEPGFHSDYPLALRMINLEPDSVYNLTVESLHSDYGFNDYDGGTFFICTSDNQSSSARPWNLISDDQMVPSTSHSITIPPQFFNTTLLDSASIKTVNGTWDYEPWLSWRSVPFDNALGYTYQDLLAGTQYLMQFFASSFECDIGFLEFHTDVLACTTPMAPDAKFYAYDYRVMYYEITQNYSYFDSITAAIEPPDAPPLREMGGYFVDLKAGTLYTLTVTVEIGSVIDCGSTNPEDLFAKRTKRAFSLKTATYPDDDDGNETVLAVVITACVVLLVVSVILNILSGTYIWRALYQRKSRNSTDDKNNLKLDDRKEVNNISAAVIGEYVASAPPSSRAQEVYDHTYDNSQVTNIHPITEANPYEME
ncbi:uncharacterized protein LOC134840139 isoform X2 [Symsagittifera roscoffensis]|uniref:uncharacterized protein LOC134840139 isoform X2 n=1 Tax=Symsagittifera roscoffensis TaxID=84072 RepID=UPI00307CB218